MSRQLIRLMRSGVSSKLNRGSSFSMIGGSANSIRSSPLVSSYSTVSNNINSHRNMNYLVQQKSIVGVRSYSSGNAVQFKLADIGEGIAECEILNWHFKVGDSIKEFDHLCDVQSDKATVEITSRYDGVITKIYYNVGDMAKVGSPLIDIVVEGSAPAAGAVAPQAAAPASAPAAAAPQQHASHDHHGDHEHNIIHVGGNPLKVLATPSVRHLAKKNGLKLNQISGTGKHGRVLKEDVLHFLNGGQQQQQQTSVQKQPTPTTPAPAPAAAHQQKDRETRIPITGIKKVMVKTMNAAALVPHFGYCEEYTMDALMSLRAQLKPLAESRDIKLSYLPFLIKATSLALLKYPILNSSMSPNETEVIVKNYHNIGVAMDTPQGLLVPNIKGVETKSIFEIAQELNRLQKVGLAGQLTPNDMSGGTFSLSNIGTIGGTYASPVLLLPEVAIGAIGKIQKLPRFDRNGNVYPVNLMQISWSADHRVIDGATMANFSNLLKSYIENPNTMLMDTR